MAGQLLTTEWIALGGFLASLVLYGAVMQGETIDAESTFLADRSLPAWMQAFSTVATNLNANDFLGKAGLAYTFGLVALASPISTVIAIIVAAFIVIPFIRRIEAFSLGEWLNSRFNSPVGEAYDFVWTFIWMLVNMGLYIYAGSLVLNTLLGWPLWPSVAVIVLIGTTYTLLGGFGAVAGSDTVQFVLMFVPFLFILPLALNEVGGISGLMSGLATHQSTIWPKNNPLGATLPFVGSRLNAFFLYLGFILFSMSYWSSESQILQRPLAAESAESAQRGYLYTGMWYALIVPFVIIIPGVIAAVLFPNLSVGDRAMPMLIKEVIPPGLYGAIIIGLLAGVLSSFDSQLNNFQTLFTERIYRRYVAQGKKEGHYLKVAKFAGIIFIIISLIMTYFFSKQPLMYVFAISILATIMPTFASVALMGGLWDEATTKGALAGIVFGLPWSVFLGFQLGHEAVYARVLYTIPTVMLVILIVSIFTSSAKDEHPTNFWRDFTSSSESVLAPSIKRLAVVLTAVVALLLLGFTVVFGL
jgi:solute:Na+ symporter, SSS family